MKTSLILLAILLAINSSHSSRDQNDKKYKVVCYWGSWSFYLKNFHPEDTNPNICTHIVFAFATLNPNNTIGIDTNLDLNDNDVNSGLPYGEGVFRRLNYLRTFNPHLTILLSVGGWSEGSDKYSAMASSASSRKVFIDAALKLLDENGFDGLDFDWEYPTLKAKTEEDRTDGNLADKQNFITLLKELRDAFQPKGYLLTAAVSPGKPTIDQAYNVPEVSQLLDIITVMTYDFHVGKETKTAHHAPLYPRSGDSEKDKQFTVEYAADYWLKSGADPKKIVLGMAFYGRGFYLASAADHGIGATAYGDGGVVDYRDLCRYLKTNEWKTYRDDVQKVPFMVNEAKKLWIGYDDEQSLTEKVNLVKSKGLGGAMVWSIDSDDFRGNCSNKKFPLLKTISKGLNGIDGPDITIPETHITAKPGATSTVGGPITGPISTVAPQTQRPGGPFKCTTAGYYGDPIDKTIFHDCVDDGKGGFRDLVSHCPAGLTFNEKAKVCT